MKSRTNIRASIVLVSVLCCFAFLLAGGALNQASAFVTLNIEKNCNPEPIFAGENMLCDIEVEKLGSDGVCDIIVSDTLPEGSTLLVNDAPNGCLPASPPYDFYCLLDSVVTGSLDSFTFHVLLGTDPFLYPNGVLSLTNAVHLRYHKTNDGQCGTRNGPWYDDDASDTVAVQESANLRITKLVKPDEEVRAGVPFTYTVFVDNFGPSAARNVTVYDTLLTNSSCRFNDNFTCSEQPCGHNGDFDNFYVSFQNPLGPISPESTGRFEYSFQVICDDTGDINNNARVASSTPDPDVSDNEVTVPLHISDVADLSITKTEDAAFNATNGWKPGLNTGYILKVCNDGPSTAENIVLKEFIPADTTLANILPATLNCYFGTPGDPSDPLVCYLGNLASGQCVPDIQLRLHLASIFPTLRLCNTASVSSDIFDDDNTDNLDTLCHQIVPSADLAITKVADKTSVSPGDLITYTITVKNNGPSVATGVIVQDTLPNDVTYVTDTDSCVVFSAGPPQVLRCPQGTMDPGETRVFQIFAKVDADIQCSSGPTKLTNTAHVQVLPEGNPQLDPDTSNNDASATVVVLNGEADLSLTKSCKPDTSALAGTEGKCDIFIRNIGPSDACNVVINDLIDSDAPFRITGIDVPGGIGMTCSPNSFPAGSIDNHRQVECTAPSLPAGSLKVITVKFTADVKADINDNAWISSDTKDPNDGNNHDSGHVGFVGSADLSITKEISQKPVIPGNIYRYTMTVHNSGPSSAMNVVLTDILPAHVTVQNYSPHTCTVGVPGDPLQPFKCNLDTIISGGDSVVWIDVLINPDFPILPSGDTVLLNTGCVGSDTADANNINNCASERTLVTAVADLSVEKHMTSAEAVAGAEVDYQVTVTNNGPSAATGVKLVDTLPAWTTFVGSNPACVENPAGTLTCDLGTLLPGTSKVVFITVKLDPSTPSGTQIINTATVSANTFDPNLGNNTDDTAADNDTVSTSADVWIDKVQNAATGNSSGTIIYDITVYNMPGCEADDQKTCWGGGPSDAQDVFVSDYLPLDAKTFVVQYTSEGCTYNVASHRVTMNVGTLKLGQSATCEIQAVVKGSKGTFENTATVSSSTPDPNGGNNSDTVKTTVQGGTGRTGGKGSGRNSK